MKRLVRPQIGGYLVLTITIVAVGLPIELLIESATDKKLAFVQRFLIMFIGVALGMIARSQFTSFLARTKVQRRQRMESTNEESIERLFESH